MSWWGTVWYRCTSARSLAACAALVSVMPFGSHEWQKWYAPSVVIRAPSAHEVVKAQFDAQGYSKHVSNSEDLWLIVRSGIEGRWYPVCRLQKLSGHAWKTTDNAIQPALGWQQIYVFEIPETADAVLIDYVNHEIKPGNGLSGLPSEARRLASEDLTVVSG
jgi:hypothetical protein